MSDTVALALINGTFGVMAALIGVWNLRETRKAKDASRQNTTAIQGVQKSADDAKVKAAQAVAVTVAGNQQVAEVKKLVNGQRDILVNRVAQLESHLRAMGATVPEPEAK